LQACLSASQIDDTYPCSSPGRIGSGLARQRVADRTRRRILHDSDISANLNCGLSTFSGFGGRVYGLGRADSRFRCRGCGTISRWFLHGGVFSFDPGEDEVLLGVWSEPDGNAVPNAPPRHVYELVAYGISGGEEFKMELALMSRGVMWVEVDFDPFSELPAVPGVSRSKLPS
jgi:hypothetical protein